MTKITAGKFITIEGIEGVGKTSNLEFVRDWLEKKNIDVVVTREPGGTTLGEALRKLLLDNESPSISSSTELMLMFAARAQHIDEIIRPALLAGKWVLCDRFTDATYAYQGGGRNLASSRISQLEDWVQGDLQPDLTLLLDAPVEIGRARAMKRSTPDRIECEQIDFFERVRSAYLEHAEHNKHRTRVIDADKPLDEVQNQIELVLQDFFG